MRLKIILPTEILIDEEVTKVNAEAENGSFCLLPHHADFVTALVPGLLTYKDQQGGENILAVDLGILVKCGSEVNVSTRNAVVGTRLETLKQTVEQEYLTKDEQERLTYAAVSRMEASFMRHFMDLESVGGG
ncbi:MAG: F0F1 ATP synthase subunit epsilon [Anaerolineales bacterium]